MTDRRALLGAARAGHLEELAYKRRIQGQLGTGFVRFAETARRAALARFAGEPEQAQAAALGWGDARLWREIKSRWHMDPPKTYPRTRPLGDLLEEVGRLARAKGPLRPNARPLRRPYSKEDTAAALKWACEKFGVTEATARRARTEHRRTAV